MNIWKISVKNFRYKPLYTFLGILILSVSIALLVGIQQLDTSFRKQMENSLGDIDMVVGAKGSPLQLVLASVLHIDNPTGNIPYEEAKKLLKNPMIEKGVPISYGDNYMGYRIVGTTPEFTALYNAILKEGKNPEKPMEVAIGATIADATGLWIGDTFQSSHGLAETGGHAHNDLLKVVGIYEPTHKVMDRLIITGLQTVWDVHDHESEPSYSKEGGVVEQEKHHHEEGEHHHDEEGHEHEHEEEHEHEGHEQETEHGHQEEHEKEITSMLISFRNPMALLTTPRTINENTNMQAALPKFELERLYQFTGVGVKTITWIAYAILVISCITIFISLYRMVRDRAFDLALMRSYGANTFQLIKMVAYEGLLISLIAFVIGVLLSQIGIYFIFEMITDQYKQKMPLELGFQELFKTAVLVLLMVLFSILLAINPIIKMNISKILSHEK
ncbi:MULTISPECIES: ABC transporter permease [Flavobacteriaceae]|uniref:ABC transporter permease n=1 Tax=Flavobacteriaceae TaxID=49546 RepID=UPI0020752B0C|nr:MULTISPECIES: ABC transporter permease [Allomuricauda]USD26593.1 ABC transporter permease [Allomuricauda aquimarina]